MRRRDDLPKKSKNYRSNVTLEGQYKDEKKRVEQLVHTSKKDNFKDQLNNAKGNSGATWKVVRKIVPKVKSNPGSHSFDNDIEKAEEFNRYFANVGRESFEKSQENVIEANRVVQPLYEMSNINSNYLFRP